MAPSRSPLWKFFSPSHDRNLMVGRCDTCLKEIKTKNWSLTGLRKHLQCKHPALFQEYSEHKAEQKSIEEKDDYVMENDNTEIDALKPVDNEISASKMKQEQTKM